MKLTMVGTGYVGLVTGACFATTGNKVTCLDVDEEKIAMLRRGESPIYEPGLTEMLNRNAAAGRLHFTTDRSEAYANAQIIFICVGTPAGEDGSADLRHVLKVAEDIAGAIGRLGPDQEPKLVVVACNTASANAMDALRENFDCPVLDVVGPGADQACIVTSRGKIGVIATEATIHSKD